jgi:hypothetical protein
MTKGNSGRVFLLSSFFPISKPPLLCVFDNFRVLTTESERPKETFLFFSVTLCLCGGDQPSFHSSQLKIVDVRSLRKCTTNGFAADARPS